MWRFEKFPDTCSSDREWKWVRIRGIHPSERSITKHIGREHLNIDAPAREACREMVHMLLDAADSGRKTLGELENPQGHLYSSVSIAACRPSK
jgi:hypothetical protein